MKHLGTPVHHMEPKDATSRTELGKAGRASPRAVATQQSFAYKVFEATRGQPDVAMNERLSSYRKQPPMLQGMTLTNPPTGGFGPSAGFGDDAGRAHVVVGSGPGGVDYNVRMPVLFTAPRVDKRAYVGSTAPLTSDGPGAETVYRVPDGKYRNSHGAMTVQRFNQELPDTAATTAARQYNRMDAELSAAGAATARLQPPDFIRAEGGRGAVSSGGIHLDSNLSKVASTSFQQRNSMTATHAQTTMPKTKQANKSHSSGSAPSSSPMQTVYAPKSQPETVLSETFAMSPQHEAVNGSKLSAHDGSSFSSAASNARFVDKLRILWKHIATSRPLRQDARISACNAHKRELLMLQISDVQMTQFYCIIVVLIVMLVLSAVYYSTNSNKR
jgi:hypothetical protein